MSVDEFIDPKLWGAVSKDLERGLHRWWMDHREELLRIGKDELREVAERLAKGDRTGAKFEVVGAMDRETWRAYRDGTTDHLRGIAARRAALARALEKLSFGAAKTIGAAILGIL